MTKCIVVCDVLKNVHTKTSKQQACEIYLYTICGPYVKTKKMNQLNYSSDTMLICTFSVGQNGYVSILAYNKFGRLLICNICNISFVILQKKFSWSTKIERDWIQSPSNLLQTKSVIEYWEALTKGKILLEMG